MSDLRFRHAYAMRAARLRREALEKDVPWDHSALLMDLAEWFHGDKIVFAEVGVGSRWLRGNADRDGLPVPDVLTFNKSYVHPMPAIYEIKVTRQDFQSDVRSDKWMKYTRICSRFYFATPRGLVKKTEVPQDAGLIVRGENGWTTVKAPKVFKAVDIGQFEMMALLMAGAYTSQMVRSIRERVNLEENVELGDRCREIGYQIGKAINQLKKGEASGSTEAQKILESVATVLGVSVFELLEMGEYDVSGRLLDAKKFEREIEIVKEAVQLLEGRWHRYGGTEYYKKQEREMRGLEKEIRTAKKKQKAEEGSRSGQQATGEASPGAELPGEEVR